MNNGPLCGVRVLEIAGLGPGPFSGMILADLGADVVRVDRPSGQSRLVPAHLDLMTRGKRSILADLKQPEDVEMTLALAERADIMVECFRPGVAERLGIGPEPCMRRRPELVYGRATGWGQEGPLAHTAGHDIDYIALTGALHAIGPSGGAPQIPLALAGDCAGGLYLTVGLLAALHEARISGRGQVVDGAIVDGTAHLMTVFYNMLGAGVWKDERGVNLFDGGAPFYGVYATSDSKYMAVGAVEPKFFTEFMSILGVDGIDDHFDPASWPSISMCVREAFLTRTQEEWTKEFDGSDACVMPVLSMSEAPDHPHMKSRGTFVDRDGITQPAPAPRFSRTPATLRRSPCVPGEHTDEILSDWLA